MKKILFISHEATRTGAPMIFLRLILWLKEHHGIEPVILLRLGGDLAGSFEQAGEVVYWRPNTGYSLLRRAVEKFVQIPNYQIKKLRKHLIRGDFDLVYANSVASSDVLRALLPDIHVPVILHVHELSAIIRMDRYFADVKGHINRFVAASGAVRDCLVNEQHIPKAKTGIVYECIDITHLDNHVKTPPEPLRKKLAGRFVVGGAGTVHWRKGPDLFILVAHELKRRGLSDAVKFVWVGKLSEQESVIVNEDLKKTGLQDMVFFTGELKEPYPIYKMFDVFLLTSREDPFPLVALESAWYNKPVICFDKGTGTAEFVQKGAGFLTPYMDIPAMADRVEELLNNRLLAQKMGIRGHELVKEYDINNIGPTIYKTIASLI